MPYIYRKKKKYDSIQREISMIRESTQNIIGHLKFVLNENNKIVEGHKRNLI